MRVQSSVGHSSVLFSNSIATDAISLSCMFILKQSDRVDNRAWNEFVVKHYVARGEEPLGITDVDSVEAAAYELQSRVSIGLREVHGELAARMQLLFFLFDDGHVGDQVCDIT